jgi:tetratricopeptide (TPR) repeat protein
VTPEDFFIQLANSLPFPYNLLAVFIIVIFILLAKFYYTHNKNKVDKFIEFHFKQITVGLILIIISTAFLAAIYFVHENFFFPEPSEDRFIVAISPFNAVSPQGYSVDNYTPGKIKDEIEEVEGNTINVVILDPPPISSDKDAVQKGKKTGAHLVIYGGDQRVVTGETITEFYIISTNASSTAPLFLDVNSSKKAISILYSDKSIRLESVEENVSSSVYTALAFEYYRKSEYISAIKMFKHVANYEKEKTILFYVGNCYLLQGNHNESLFNESLVYFNKTIEIDPNNSFAWTNKGYILNNLGKYDDSIQAYDKAIEIDPNDSPIWTGKGLVLSNCGKYHDAIIAYDKAIEINPDYPFAWTGRGLVLDNLGKYDEAIEAYNKAIEIDPNYSPTWTGKGLVLYKLGNYDDAIKAYDKAIEINPNSSLDWDNKGLALYSLGKYDDAMRAYDRAIEIDHNNSFAWNDKGFAFYDLGKYEEALKAYDKAIEINPNYSLAWYNRARIHSIIDNKEQALSDLMRALELDSSYKEIARNDSDFEELWTNKEFKKLVNSNN